jgi:hypothetical protein
MPTGAKGPEGSTHALEAALSVMTGSAAVSTPFESEVLSMSTHRDHTPFHR